MRDTYVLALLKKGAKKGSGAVGKWRWTEGMWMTMGLFYSAI